MFSRWCTRNYEIWYTYAQNSNRAFNRNIDTIVAAGSPLAESDLKALYDTHFGAGRMLGQMQTIGAGLSGSLGRARCQFGGADSASEYAQPWIWPLGSWRRPTTGRRCWLS